ncbi:hypothetical protein BD560DRAFT_450781 [Blakeslea trispora]|nr:hypothetical protein BD560DRAFT_450781 [Blakeslea trispora]
MSAFILEGAPRFVLAWVRLMCKLNPVSSTKMQFCKHHVVKINLVVDSAYDNYISADILSRINKKYKKKIWGPPKRFPSCVKAELEDVISDFEDDCFEDLEEFKDKLSKMRLNQTNPAVKRLIGLVSCLADELVAKEKKIGEMQLQTSFVHSLMKAMFKISKDHDAYASNLVFDKDDEILKNCRPDYLVEVKGAQKNVVGEVKPSGTSKVGVEWDVLRLGVFGRQILSRGGVDAVVCFHVVGKQLKFYIMTKAKNVFLMNHIETITLPFFYSDLKTFPSQLNSIFNIMHIYEQFCKPNPSSSPLPTPFPSFEMYKNIYANNKKQKICQ